MVSQGGGSQPRWRRDGTELFVLAPDGTLMASEVGGGPGFQAGIPKALFKVVLASGSQWDVGPDGSKFLFPVVGGMETTESAPFAVVLNWMAALKK